MTTKNPFEIRSDLLKQAQDLMTNQFQFNYNLFLEAANNTKDLMVNLDGITPKCPLFPSTEEVIAQAEKFYSFVSKGSK